MSKAEGDALPLAATALRPLLVRWFARRVPPSDVDDLVQDVFLRIIKRGDVEELDNLQAYFFKTAASVLADKVRSLNSRKADRHVVFDQNLHAQAAVGPDEILTARQELRSTTRVLLQMPERTRTIFILRRIEGMPMAAIAQRLGLSVSAVEKHMQRATKYLVVSMEDLK